MTCLQFKTNENRFGGFSCGHDRTFVDYSDPGIIICYWPYEPSRAHGSAIHLPMYVRVNNKKRQQQFTKRESCAARSLNLPVGEFFGESEIGDF